MNYIIENESIRVSICDVGSELQSIYNKKNNTEYLWQGDEKYWNGKAYNLFPICGRLYDGKYTYRGKEYEMGIHGFVRSSLMTLADKTEKCVTFELRANEATLAQYPFDFLYRITTEIDGTAIKTTITVKNLGENDRYFGIGGHPGFNVPLNEGESFEDYYLEFDCVKPAERLICTPLFYTGKTMPYPMTNGKIIELSHDLFLDDSKFFTNMCRKVTLKSRKSDSFIRMEYTDFKYVGLWHAPRTEAPYICIEPWTSLPSYDGIIDDMETKNEMTRLASGENYSIGFNIIIG